LVYIRREKLLEAFLFGPYCVTLTISKQTNKHKKIPDLGRVLSFGKRDDMMQGEPPIAIGVFQNLA